MRDCPLSLTDGLPAWVIQEVQSSEQLFECPRLRRKRWRLIKVYTHKRSMKSGFWRLQVLLSDVHDCRGNQEKQRRVEERLITLETGKSAGGGSAIRLQWGPTNGKLVLPQGEAAFSEMSKVRGPMATRDLAIGGSTLR